MAKPTVEMTLATGDRTTPSDQRRFFSSADQLLYGAFNPAERPGNKPVVVFCNSFGAGHFVTVRMEALAARMVARRGYPAFRYHARGHGDSTGNFRERNIPEAPETRRAYSAADSASTRPSYLFANLAPETRRRFEIEIWPGLASAPRKNGGKPRVEPRLAGRFGDSR